MWRGRGTGINKLRDCIFQKHLSREWLTIVTIGQGQLPVSVPLCVCPSSLGNKENQGEWVVSLNPTVYTMVFQNMHYSKLSNRLCVQGSHPSSCICQYPETRGELLLFPWWIVYCCESHWGGLGNPLVLLVHVARWRMCHPHIYTSRQACVWLFL